MKKIILIVLAIIVFFAMGTKAGYGDKTIEKVLLSAPSICISRLMMMI